MAACACATEMRAYGYQAVLDILQKGTDMDFMPDADEQTQALPQHKNIRGRDYFSQITEKNNKK